MPRISYWETRTGTVLTTRTLKDLHPLSSTVFQRSSQWDAWISGQERPWAAEAWLFECWSHNSLCSCDTAASDRFQHPAVLAGCLFPCFRGSCDLQLPALRAYQLLGWSQVGRACGCISLIGRKTPIHFQSQFPSTKMKDQQHLRSSGAVAELSQRFFRGSPPQDGNFTKHCCIGA